MLDDLDVLRWKLAYIPDRCHFYRWWAFPWECANPNHSTAYRDKFVCWRWRERCVAFYCNTYQLVANPKLSLGTSSQKGCVKLHYEIWTIFKTAVVILTAQLSLQKKAFDDLNKYHAERNTFRILSVQQKWRARNVHPFSVEHITKKRQHYPFILQICKHRLYAHMIFSCKPRARGVHTQRGTTLVCSQNVWWAFAPNIPLWTYWDQTLTEFDMDTETVFTCGRWRTATCSSTTEWRCMLRVTKSLWRHFTDRIADHLSEKRFQQWFGLMFMGNRPAFWAGSECQDIEDDGLPFWNARLTVDAETMVAAAI